MSDDRKNLDFSFSAAPKAGGEPTLSARVREGDVSMAKTFTMEAAFLDAWQERLARQRAEYENAVSSGADPIYRRQAITLTVTDPAGGTPTLDAELVEGLVQMTHVFDLQDELIKLARRRLKAQKAKVAEKSLPPRNLASAASDPDD